MAKDQWIRLGLFLTACVVVIVSVVLNKVEIALLSSILMFFSFVNYKKPVNKNIEKKAFEKGKIDPDRLIRALSLGFYAVISGGVAVFFSTKPSTGAIALSLWVISIGLLFAAGMVFDRLHPFAWIKKTRSLDPKKRRDFYLEVSIVVVLTCIALLLRASNLEFYPTSMHGDEGEMGMEALRFLGVGDPIAPFSVGWGPLPNLFYLVQAGFIAIFGRNAIGLRMASAVFGTACVPLVYLFGKKYWGKIAGFSGAWLMTVSHFHIQYSRLGVNNIHSAFFMILFLLLFILPDSKKPDQEKDLSGNNSDSDLKRGNEITPYIAMGVSAALAQYMYLGSRLIPLVALPLILYQLIRKRISVTQIALLGFAAILVFAPLGFHYLQHPNELTTRMDAVSIFNPDNIRNNYGEEATLANSIIKIFANQFERNLAFFLQSGDGSSFYYANMPAFDYITALLFWLGLGVVFARPRRLPELVLIVWFSLGIILGGVITNDSPNGTRLLITVSSIYIIGGVFLQRTWDAIQNFLKKIPNLHHSLAWVFVPILFVAMIATAAVNINYNFLVYPKAGVNILSISVSKEIILDAPNNHVYLFGEGDLYAGHGTIRYLAGDGKVEDLKKLDQLPALVNDGKGIVVLATYSNFEEFAAMETLYPGGSMTEEFVDGHLVFMKYQLQPQS